MVSVGVMLVVAVGVDEGLVSNIGITEEHIPSPVKPGDPKGLVQSAPIGEDMFVINGQY